MIDHPTNAELIDYIHGALAAEADASVYAHLEVCPRCREEYAAEVTLSELLRREATREEREIPPTVKGEIWKRIRNAEPTGFARFRAFFRPAVALPLAVAIALIAFLGPVYERAQHGAPSIDASYYLQGHAAMNGTVPFSDQTGADPSALENVSATYPAQGVTAMAPASYTTADVRP